MAPRLRSLTVRGFRAFGAAEQTLRLPSDIAAVWGPNSKGKTSLAEALEFLLTGRIARRELMASSQDEFADALRNAHLKDGEPTYVVARILAADGKEHEVKRTLTQDYGKRQDCASRLEIDGVDPGALGLAALGIVLSQPPLQAPVLAQHTLGYLFTAGPLDRATYFKSLLELTDLDHFRNEIAALSVGGEGGAVAPLLDKLERCAAIPALATELARIRGSAPDLATVTSALGNSARLLLENAGQPVPADPAGRAAAIRDALASKRSKAFPVSLLDSRKPSAWSEPAKAEWDRVQLYFDERAKTEKKVQQLVALFEQALSLPEVVSADRALDCPLCDAKATLSPVRVEFLRQQVQQAQSFTSAERNARSALAQITATVRGLRAAADAALPKALTTRSADRKQLGFSTVRMRELLGHEGEQLTRAWLVSIRPLRRAADSLGSEVERAVVLVEKLTSDLARAVSVEDLVRECSGLQARATALADASRNYQEQTEPLRKALDAVLDVRADTKGWQDFLDLASDPVALHAALVDRAAQASVMKELGQALRQIDDAKEQVLNDKFGEYSDLVEAWWERLRPGEPTFFQTVQPRKGTKRTVDIKVGLSSHADRSSPKLRDAIAVFSQSQVHCLGLALFLARAQRECAGFVLLDDPVLSSDDDYQTHFRTAVVEELLQVPLQVIVVTQSHETWKDLDVRYRHRGIAMAQLMILDPADGSVIENTSDQMQSIISRAQALALNGHPDVRKECGVQLRTAGERFCKEFIVRNEEKKGNAGASVNDYDGKTLEWLVPKVTPLLSLEPSHSGKLVAFKNMLNPSCHDDAPPNGTVLNQACGELRYLVGQYLPTPA